MNRTVFVVIALNIMAFVAKGQQTPFFVGSTLEDNGAQGDDDVNTWNYKGYIFRTVTPGVARPLNHTFIYKKGLRGLTLIENEALFGVNKDKVTSMINNKLKMTFLLQKKEDPSCFKVFSPTHLNDLIIYVDKNNMYFEKVWDTSYIGDIHAECIFPSTKVEFSLSEIQHLIN